MFTRLTYINTLIHWGWLWRLPYHTVILSSLFAQKRVFSELKNINFQPPISHNISNFHHVFFTASKQQPDTPLYTYIIEFPRSLHLPPARSASPFGPASQQTAIYHSLLSPLQQTEQGSLDLCTTFLCSARHKNKLAFFLCPKRINDKSAYVSTPTDPLHTSALLRSYILHTFGATNRSLLITPHTLRHTVHGSSSVIMLSGCAVSINVRRILSVCAFIAFEMRHRTPSVIKFRRRVDALQISYSADWRRDPAALREIRVISGA